jgi:integrase
VYYLLLRETGLRVSELAGIVVGDVSLQDRSLHVQPNDIRGLKTKGSQRVIPLSDTSLAALQQHRQGKEDCDPVFPRYARTNGNTSLSAMMMKHFRKAITDPKKSLHSLRHRMKDALRNTGCGDELGKSILGHTTAGVSARYGSGHSVETMREALEKVW